MRIVSFKLCPFVQRVTASLEAKGAAYEIEHIELSDKPDWFVAASPHGQVPILFTDDGRALFESDAIVEYVEEVAPSPLLPSDPVEKAQARAWAQLASKNYLVQCAAQRSGDAGTLDERAAPLAAAFAKIGRRLDVRPFAGGHSIGMVDVAWLVLLHRAAIVAARSGYDFLAGLPRVKAWQEAVLATGLAKKSVSGDFEERFAAFYLSESTHLGQLARARAGQARDGEASRATEDAACCARRPASVASAPRLAG